MFESENPIRIVQNNSQGSVLVRRPLSQALLAGDNYFGVHFRGITRKSGSPERLYGIT